MCQDCDNNITDSPIGPPGNDGSDGQDGASAYVYIASADDNIGTGFTYPANVTDCWLAIITTTSPLTTPQASDFASYWFNKCGTTGTGTQGQRGETGNTPTFEIGTVTSGTADVSINSGSTIDNVILDFVLQKGDNGTAGTKWTNGVGYPSTAGTNVGDYYLDTVSGSVYKYIGPGASDWGSAITVLKGATGATGPSGPTGATGDSATATTLTSEDGSVTLSLVDNNYDLSVVTGLNTFIANVNISNTAYSSASSVIPINTGTEGITDGQLIIEYNVVNYNNTTITYSGSVPYNNDYTLNDMGTWNSTNGELIISTPGLYLIEGTIHLKSNTSSSLDWESSYSATNSNSFGIGIVDDSSTNIYVGNYQTITNSTRQIDLSTSKILKLNDGDSIRLKVLNWSSRAYDGSGYTNGDGISLQVTQLRKL